MPTLAILCGLPGSGKSTLGRKLKAERDFFVVSTDSLRMSVNAGVYPRQTTGEYSTLETVVWDMARLAVEKLLAAGHNVAIDAIAGSPTRRAEWRELARRVAVEARVEIHWCRGTWDSAERWATERMVTQAEYREIRDRVECEFIPPTETEADELVIHPTLATELSDGTMDQIELSHIKHQPQTPPVCAVNFHTRCLDSYWAG